MNVTEPCIICNSINFCECKTAVHSFFNLLESANKRVLSTKPSSISSEIKPCNAGIDKINGYFTTSISKADVIESANLNNYHFKSVFLKDRSEYLEVKNENGKIHLRLDRTKTYLTGYVSNPNHFNSWDQFTDFFKSSTTLSDFGNAKISRLDLNLDYPIHFNKFISHLDITNKRASLAFIDEAGERTGLIIGKGTETIAIYNKAKQTNLRTPLTRVEIRLKQNKLPAKTLDNLTNVIQSKSYFENLNLINLSFNQVYISDQKTKQDRFKHTCERDGYYLARKSENLTRNFDRDFKNIISVEPNETQPNDHFKRHIGDFINPNKEEKYV